MARVLRKKKQPEVENSENVPVKPTDKNGKVTKSNKSIKQVLCDRTNANDNDCVKLNSDVQLKFHGTKQNEKLKSRKNNIQSSVKVNTGQIKSNTNKLIQSKTGPIKVLTSGKVLTDCLSNSNDNVWLKSNCDRKVEIRSKENQNVRPEKMNTQMSTEFSRCELIKSCQKTSPNMQNPFTLNSKPVLYDCTNLNDNISNKVNNIKVAKSNASGDTIKSKSIRRTRLSVSKDDCNSLEVSGGTTSSILPLNKKCKLNSSGRSVRNKAVMKSEDENNSLRAKTNNANLNSSELKEVDITLGINKGEKSALLDANLQHHENSVNIMSDKNTSPFLGFKTAVKSPALDVLKKHLNNSCNDNNSGNSKVHLPIYKTNKPSPKLDLNKAELYEFEVDENEPVPKKRRKKPILKIKKHRTYKSKKVVIPYVPFKETKILTSRNQENICPNIQPNPKPLIGYTPVSPIPERVYSEALNESIGNDLNTSQNVHVSDRQSLLYSPPPYQSPKRGSLGVPIIRASVSHEQDVQCSKSLNASRSSSKHNLSVNSAYSVNFTSPMYLGSSTPIHRHWTEQTNHVYSNATVTDCHLFDASNNFGFEVLDDIDEPIVSPIKRYETPHKGITPKKPSPVKIPHRQVIRMLKFGPDTPRDTSLDEEKPSIDQLLPANFFHDGSTPNFSPPSTPPDPVFLKKGCKNNKSKNSKKKAVIVEEMEDSDFATQSSEDKTSQDDEIQRNDRAITRTLRSNRTMNTTKINQSSSKNLKSNETLSRTRKNVCFDDSDMDKDIGYETEVSPSKKSKLDVSKQHRRSYERPPYLRGKKYGRKDVDKEEDTEDEEEEVAVKAKPQPKKKNALSRKEELELENWAKAFNEQCMQVDSFNLVVE